MPEVNDANVDRDYLRSLPDRSFGREYAKFLDRLKTSPDARPLVQFIDDPDLAYVMRRYRQTHDFYHTVLDMPTNMLGEVTVKWWEGIQLGFPMCVLGGVFGAFRLYPKQRKKYLSANLPWVIRAAPRATFFMNVYWEKHWEKQLVDLRRELGIEEPPL